MKKIIPQDQLVIEVHDQKNLYIAPTNFILFFE